MQLQIFDWFTDNIWLTLANLTIIIVFLVALYIKRYVRMFSPQLHIIHYRRGRILREYPNGGLIVTIPFFDHLEGRLNTSSGISEDESSL